MGGIFQDWGFQMVLGAARSMCVFGWGGPSVFLLKVFFFFFLEA